MFGSASLSIQGAARSREGFSSGEVLGGEVQIITRGPLTTRSITVLLYGLEKVTVETSEVEVELDGRVKPKCHFYSEKTTLINRYHVCLGARLNQASGSKKLQLNQTEVDCPHVFPFAFKLPEILPGSISTGGFLSNHSGDVKYWIEARIDRPGCLTDTTVSFPIRIYGNSYSADNVSSLLKAALRPNSVKVSKAFSMSEGRLEATATLPAKGIQAGRTLKLRLKVENGTNVALAKIRVKLNTKILVKAGGHCDGSSKSTLLSVISCTTGHEAARTALTAARQNAEVEMLVSVPTSALSTHTSAHISTEHAFELELVPEGWLHYPLSLLLPVQVLAPSPPPAATMAAPAVAASKTLKATPAAVVTSIPTNTTTTSASASAPPIPAVAITAADADDVRAALDEVGGTVTSCGKKGHTALHLAALRGQPELCRLLIAEGCDYKALTLKGFTPLHGAAFWSSIDCCAVILSEAWMSGGMSAVGELRAAKTAKGSTASALAKLEITGEFPSKANKELGLFLDTWQQPAEAQKEKEGVVLDSDRDGGRDEREIQKESAEDSATAEDENGSGNENKSPASGRDNLCSNADVTPIPAPVPTPRLAPAPSIVEWQRDDDVSRCPTCQSDFNYIFLWKHHCRGCGQVFCRNCAWARTAGAGTGAVANTAKPNTNERLCDACSE